MEIKSFICPSCGGTIDNSIKGRLKFCPYCGAKLFVQYDNEYVTRNIDEAEVAQAEYNYDIRLQQVKIEAEERAYRRRLEEQEILHQRLITKIILYAALVFLGLGVIVCWFTIDRYDSKIFVGLIMLVIGGVLGIIAVSRANASKIGKPEEENNQDSD